MSFSDNIISALTTCRDILSGPVFSLDGAEYPCVISTADRMETLEVGGFVVNIRMSVHVLKTTIDGVDVGDGKIIGIREHEYRIVRVRHSPDGSHDIYDVADPYSPNV